MKKTNNTSMILWGIGGIAMILAGIYSFFITGATVATISNMLGVIAVVTGVITLFMRVMEKKHGDPLRLDFLIWFAIAFLMFNTSLLTALGGLIFFILGIFLVIQGVNSIRIELTSSSKDIVKMVISVLFVLVGVYAIFNSRHAFNDLVGKIIGVYLVIHGVEMLKNMWGQAKYNSNFKGVE